MSRLRDVSRWDTASIYWAENEWSVPYFSVVAAARDRPLADEWYHWFHDTVREPISGLARLRVITCTHCGCKLCVRRVAFPARCRDCSAPTQPDGGDGRWRCKFTCAPSSQCNHGMLHQVAFMRNQGVGEHDIDFDETDDNAYRSEEDEEADERGYAAETE